MRYLGTSIAEPLVLVAHPGSKCPRKMLAHTINVCRIHMPTLLRCSVSCLHLERSCRFCITRKFTLKADDADASWFILGELRR